MGLLKVINNLADDCKARSDCAYMQADRALAPVLKKKKNKFAVQGEPEQMFQMAHLPMMENNFANIY